MALQPNGEVVDDRRRLVALVDKALSLLAEGGAADALETESVDFKEEAGRRGRGGIILPGQPRSEAVATQLADEVACLANTPGGGALIVGVADNGEPVGAASDRRDRFGGSGFEATRRTRQPGGVRHASGRLRSTGESCCPAPGFTGGGS